MNLKERLRHLAYESARQRGTGRTSLIAQAASYLAGVLVVSSHQEATHLGRKFKGITIRSIDTNLSGFGGPLFFDHFALERIFTRAADKIETLEKELEEERKLKQESQDMLDGMKAKINMLQEMLGENK